MMSLFIPNNVFIFTGNESCKNWLPVIRQVIFLKIS